MADTAGNTRMDSSEIVEAAGKVSGALQSLEAAATDVGKAAGTTVDGFGGEGDIVVAVQSVQKEVDGICTALNQLVENLITALKSSAQTAEAQEAATAKAYKDFIQSGTGSN